jgi:hypothetical protein
MKIIQKVLSNLNTHDYYIKHLQIINPFLPLQLTPTEIEVLAAFMSLDGEVAEKDRFGTSMRKQVKSQLDNMSAGGMSNHLRHLLDKGAIFKDNGQLTIRPFLFPEEDGQGYQFKITRV